MKDKLFREEYTIMRSTRGGIGIAVTASAVMLIVLLPAISFITKCLVTISLTDNAGDFLQIASVSAFQGISQEDLGRAYFEFDSSLAYNKFYQCLDDLLERYVSHDRFGQASVNFLILPEKITILSSLPVITEFGRQIIISNSTDFIVDKITEVD